MPPTLAELNSSDRDVFVAALGHLFEHSPWVAAETFGKRPFRSLEELHGALCATMRARAGRKAAGADPAPIPTSRAASPGRAS